MYRKSKSMFGKLLLLLLTLCCAIVLLFGLAACSETKGIASAVINDNGELVITYTDGTSDNLGVVVGKDGEDGKEVKTEPPAKTALTAKTEKTEPTDAAYPRSSSAQTAPSLSLHIRTTPRRR